MREFELSWHEIDSINCVSAKTELRAITTETQLKNDKKSRASHSKNSP